MTKAGRDFARANPGDGAEVRFENLIADPAGTLARIGTFIDHDLDYARIQQNPVHALVVPNTSFRNERRSPDFNLVGRWQTKISAEDLALCDALIGPTLHELGYDNSQPSPSRTDPRTRLMRAFYPHFYVTKHFLKTSTRAQPHADLAPAFEIDGIIRKAINPGRGSGCASGRRY
jgi:hypothetical protein